MSASDPAARPARLVEDADRQSLLELLERWLERPMLFLAVVWLTLLVVEVARGESPMLEALGTLIWVVFLLDFGLRFSLAPRKGRYLRENWLTALSLVLPALRLFRLVQVVRALRVARATRGLRLVRVVTTVNRGLRTLGSTMSRRGLGYVLGATSIVLLAGAAGIYAFERTAPSGGAMHDFGTALWWTAMILTTMGSEYWPKTAEGRVLCLLLAIYAFAVFGYLTAALASYFVGRDADRADGEVAGRQRLDEVRREVASLHDEVRRLVATIERAHQEQGR